MTTGALIQSKCQQETVKRIFWSTPNEVLTAHTEWLQGVKQRHFSTTCAVYKENCGSWWLSGCRSSVADCTSQVSWVWFPVTADFFTYFHLKTYNVFFHCAVLIDMIYQWSSLKFWKGVFRASFALTLLPGSCAHESLGMRLLLHK